MKAFIGWAEDGLGIPEIGVVLWFVKDLVQDPGMICGRLRYGGSVGVNRFSEHGPTGQFCELLCVCATGPPQVLYLAYKEPPGVVRRCCSSEERDRFR